MSSLGPYTLAPFQLEGAKFIASRKYSLLADDMGLGKTLQALEAALIMGAKRFIVVCPGFLCLQWEKKIKEYYGEQFNVCRVIGSKSLLTHTWSDSAAIVVSYEMATRRLKEIAQTEYDFAIFDESHYMKNSKAKRTHTILGAHSFLVKTKKAVLMTGTPMINRPIDLYTILRCFVPEVLGKYIAWPFFVARYCGHMGKGSKNEDELGAKLQTFMLRRMKKDVLEQLPKLSINRVYMDGITIPVEYRDELAVIQRREVAIAKLPKTEEYLKDLLNNIDKIVVIAYHRNTIETLKETFKHSNPAVVYGGLSQDVKQAQIDKFIQDDSCKVVFAQISTIGIGVDGFQTVCDRIVFAELDWSPAILQQAIDRLYRIGQKSTHVQADFLIASDTIEMGIDLSLTKKEELIDKIVGGTNSVVTKGVIMPHGHSQKQWDNLSPKAREAFDKYGKTPRDNGIEVERYYEKQEVLKKEIQRMAKPKPVMGDNKEKVNKAGELLLKAFTAYISTVVHDIVNGGLPDTMTDRADASFPQEDAPPPSMQEYSEPDPIRSSIPAHSEDNAPVTSMSKPPRVVTPEELTEEAKVFLAKLEVNGLTKDQALGVYRGEILLGFSSVKAAEMTPDERAIALTSMAQTTDEGIKNLVSPFTQSEL